MFRLICSLKGLILYVFSFTRLSQEFPNGKEFKTVTLGRNFRNKFQTLRYCMNNTEK